MYNCPLKTITAAVLLAALIAGCAGTDAAEPTAVPAETAPAAEPEGYDRYLERMNAMPKMDNYTAGVQRSYDMKLEDGSRSAYDLDGVLMEQDGRIHLTQHLYSDGMRSEADGWYDGSRLYMTYNQVNYYEDMDPDSVREIAMVPLTPVTVRKEDIASMDCHPEEGNESCTFVLKPQNASVLFDERYDIYGLNSSGGYEMNTGTIVQTFQPDGTIVSEAASFLCSMNVKGMNVSVEAKTYAGWMDIGTTEVNLTNEQKETFASYVNFRDIDTSKISDADITADTAEATAEGTFRKRLQSRLSYKLQEDGTYLAEFNDAESYRVDFEHHIFTYSNHTSHYIYNWQGDIGGFEDACVYAFSDQTSASECEESVIEQIRNVKKFFVMELYYCGLSLEDLRAEV